MKPEYIIVHCTDVSYKKNKNQFFAVNRYHRDVKGFPKSSLGWYGGYHTLVSGGVERRYREDWEVGAHCNEVVDGLSMNKQSLGVCWAGDGDIEFPSAEDTKLIKKRINKWQTKYNIPNDKIYISPHRRWKPSKTCYGALLSDDWAFLLNNPVEKDTEQLEKQEMINKLSRRLIDLLLQMILQLKIALNLQSRIKIPPVKRVSH